MVEVEVFQSFHCREVDGADPHGGAGGFTIGELALQYRGEVFLVRPVLVAGVIGELFPDPSDGRYFQHLVRYAICDGSPSAGKAATAVAWSSAFFLVAVDIMT